MDSLAPLDNVMIERLWRSQPGAAAQTRHLGRGSGLIDEHQPEGIEIGLLDEPGQPARRDVRPIPLGGVRGFF